MKKAAAEGKYREAIALNPEHPFAWANLVPPPRRVQGYRGTSLIRNHPPKPPNL